MKSISKICFLTYGCKVNQVDTDRMMSILSSDYKILDNYKTADLCIVNTCTVTNNSDNQILNDIKKLKKTNPSCKVLVTGCLAQTEPDYLETVSSIDYVVDNANKYLLPKVLKNLCNSKKIISNIFDIDKFHDYEIKNRDKRSRAFLKIQDGCNYRCSFCIIPFARGKSRSMQMDSVLQKIDKYKDLGYEEIVLTGIHLSSYGKDINESLLSLLELIELKSTIKNIRLSSIDPADTDQKLINFISKSDKICPSFHISLQSGEDNILREMKRRYKVNQFEEIINEIRFKIPDSCIGTDVIVGFPGESEKSFNQTFNFLEKSELNYFHVFPYSDRKGTKANQREDKIPTTIKSKRSKLLRDLSDNKKQEFYSRFIGKELEAIVEKNNKARTRNYIDVNLDGESLIPGSLVNLLIKEVKSMKAYGCKV
tara:strand:- start:3193 stop:4467 length:1275 start_codon:yes stop_codon:yes gene_type:complete